MLLWFRTRAPFALPPCPVGRLPGSYPETALRDMLRPLTGVSERFAEADFRAQVKHSEKLVGKKWRGAITAHVERETRLATDSAARPWDPPARRARPESPPRAMQ